MVQLSSYNVSLTRIIIGESKSILYQTSTDRICLEVKIINNFCSKQGNIDFIFFQIVPKNYK